MQPSCQSVITKNLLPSLEGNKTGMDTRTLSDWVKSEKSKGISYRGLAKALNVSGTAVGKWAKQEVTDLLDTTVASIAAYKGASLADTYEWLALPQPVDTSDAKRIEDLERALKDILGIVEQRKARY